MPTKKPDNLDYIILYNRKRHRYECYAGAELLAFSAYAERLRHEYPDAKHDYKHEVPDTEETVRDIDREKEW